MIGIGITILSINVAMLGVALVKIQIALFRAVTETELIWKLNDRNWYNNIVNQCCHAWRRFSENTNSIISRCYRD
tara:strand:- start:4338 stop:4562 length:225 start_codon:yes stop_codon:yes gene_type:complete